jgi:hypothetical protein
MSLMPKDILDTLSEGELRGFFTFLRSPSGQAAKP